MTIIEQIQSAVSRKYGARNSIAVFMALENYTPSAQVKKDFGEGACNALADMQRELRDTQ